MALVILFQLELQQPPTAGKHIGLVGGWYNVSDNNSTMQRNSFKVVDGTVSGTGEFTYQIRLYHSGNVSFSFNKTRRTTETVVGGNVYENVTSHLFVEEVL